MKTFRLTESHLKLLRRANVSWCGDEHGAPQIDPKRPDLLQAACEGFGEYLLLKLPDGSRVAITMESRED